MKNELDQLIEKFLKEHSFNNIELLLTNRKIVALDAASLEDKLIVRNRGGYCFENNQYFYNYLKERGYEVSRYLGRVVYGGTDEVPRTHQLSVVTIAGEKLLADVGFGPYCPGRAVPLNGEEVTSFNGNRYRVVRINNENYQLETLRGDDYFSLYQFNFSEYNDADFKLSNYYTNTHDESKFTTSLMLAQLTSHGVKFISFLTYTALEEGMREDIDFQKSEDFVKMIKKEFKVSYSDEELTKLYFITKELEDKARQKAMGI